MNKEWTEFLTSRATVDHNNSELNCAMNDLSHYGLIQVIGTDAEEFLQGQLTNDIRKVTEIHSNIAGWCNPKGRLIDNFRCFRDKDTIYLQTLLEHIPTVLERLSKYVLRAQVTLSDVSDELIRIGFTGSCAEALLEPYFDEIPEQVNDVQQADGLTLIRLPGGKPRYEVIGPVASLREIWQISEGQVSLADANFWSMQEIHAGIPTIHEHTQETFVPQMMNLQLINGISFTKGCYVGQEVVARMQHLGKLKRRMYLAHVESKTPPNPGDELYAQESTSGQGAGKVVDAQANGSGFDLLAVIEISSAEAGKVLLGKEGPALELMNLPYPFQDKA
jgi:folate-binding protein YgfZ